MLADAYCVCWVWALVAGSISVVKLLGGRLQSGNVVKPVGGTVEAVTVLSDCYKILRREKGHSSVVKLLGGQAPVVG